MMDDRVAPIDRTLSLVPALRERFGITRIGELTYLDRIGMPVMTAIVPKSPDNLGVYNGKGLTRERAIVGAVMEAVERQMCAAYEPATSYVAVREIEQHLDLRNAGLYERLHTAELECVEGIDLLKKQTVLVPLALVRCPWKGEPIFRSTSTNGLASGNTFSEAVYHALFELVERHVWSMTHIKIDLGPRLLFGDATSDRIEEVIRMLEFPTGLREIDALIEQIARAGIRLRVLVLQERDLPVTMLATLTEEHTAMPLFSLGIAASWSPARAAVRAISEAVQSRAVDIQAAREDMLRPADENTQYFAHARRAAQLPRGKWFFDGPALPVALASLPDRSSGDMDEELERLVRVLHQIGAPTIAAVNVAPGETAFGVARVIVPEMETYCVDRRVGRFARALFAIPGMENWKGTLRG